MRRKRIITKVIGSEGCSWRTDDGSPCGRPADAFRTKHWPTHSKTWFYCPLHRYALRVIALDRPVAA